MKPIFSQVGEREKQKKHRQNSIPRTGINEVMTAFSQVITNLD
jgi:hypothetical protein